MSALGPSLVVALFLIPAQQDIPRGVDHLLSLLPPRSAAVLTLEGLRERGHRLREMPLWTALREVPAYRSWRDSDDWKRLDRARRDVEAMLGTALDAACDDILGDAVTLSLHLPSNGLADEPRGLVLLEPRDPALLNRVIEAVNARESKVGSLRSLVPRNWNKAEYQVRTFEPGTKPDEFYGWITPAIFAWSNSEELLRGAIERSAKNAPDNQPPEWLRPLRSALPRQALARLYVDRALIDRAGAWHLGAIAAGDSPALPGVVSRSLDAFRSFAIAFKADDGLELHVAEYIDPDRLDASARRLLSAGKTQESLLALIPADTMAVASGAVDWCALVDLLRNALPESEKTRAGQAELLLSGLLLGREVSTEILPALGPGFLALMLKASDSPTHGGLNLPPAAIVLELANSPEVAKALDNGLRTLLAMIALDPKRPPGLRVETIALRGSSVTRLSAGSSSLAFHVGPNRLVLGNSDGLVSDLAQGKPSSGEPSGLMQLRQARFPDAQHFVVADFVAMAAWLRNNRDALVKLSADDAPQAAESSADDLDQALQLLRLFRAGFIASHVSADGRVVHQSFGLLPK